MILLVPSKAVSSLKEIDNALIAREIVHFMHKKNGKVGFLIFKIDFEKAYDLIN